MDSELIDALVSSAQVNLPPLWRVVGQRMDDHIRAGRAHLLTEDVLRFETVAALEAQGVAPSRMAIEHLLPDRGKLDLVLDSPPSVAIEFKFPRDSRTGVSADTMTLGEMLKDFYRLGDHPEIAERWAVLLLNERLVRYLERRTDCRWTFDVGDALRFEPDGHSRLPATAGSQLAKWAHAVAVATCEVAVPLAGSRLVAFRIQ